MHRFADLNPTVGDLEYAVRRWRSNRPAFDQNLRCLSAPLTSPPRGIVAPVMHVRRTESDNDRVTGTVHGDPRVMEFDLCRHALSLANDWPMCRRIGRSRLVAGEAGAVGTIGLFDTPNASGIGNAPDLRVIPILDYTISFARMGMRRPVELEPWLKPRAWVEDAETPAQQKRRLAAWMAGSFFNTPKWEGVPDEGFAIYAAARAALGESLEDLYSHQPRLLRRGTQPPPPSSG